jgi:hypothetical protein
LTPRIHHLIILFKDVHLRIYHTTSLSSAATILRGGFLDYAHYLDGQSGVWVTDLPYHAGSTTLVCQKFPNDIFARFEDDWAHAWRKAFIPASILNDFTWSWHELGVSPRFRSPSSPEIGP